jgi:hypothetical protein
MAVPLTAKAQTQSVTIGWSPGSGTTAGYNVQYGTDGTNFGSQLNAGSNYSAVITGLAPGTTYYFQVVAYDTNNNLSAPTSAITYTTPAPSNTLNVVVSPASSGTVTGGGSYAQGSSVTANATPASGYAFSSWTLGGVVQSTSPSYTFVLTNSFRLVANFTAIPVTYSVAIQGNPSPGGTLTGGGVYSAGASVTVSATANSGYTFSNWTEKGVVQTTSPSYSFTAAANRNLVANFASNTPAYTVSAQINPAAGGTVSGLGSFTTGTMVVLNATANSGYTFSNWTANGMIASTASKYSFILTNDCSVAANFSRSAVIGNINSNSSTYTVTATASTNGQVNPSGPQTVGAGSNITFTASPATNYQVGQWLVNGVLVQTGGTGFTLQNVSTNEAVSVNFNAVPPPTNSPVNTNFALVISGNGAVTPAMSSSAFQYGKRYTLTAAPGKNSLFVNWTSNGAVVATSSRYSFVVASNFVLQANFVTNPFVLVAGTYRGLFYDTNGATPASSGSFVATVTAAGKFSAKHTVAGKSYSYSGSFGTDGSTTKTIARPNATPVTVQLQLGAGQEPITGTINDGASVAALVAVPSGYSRTNPAPQAGKYTLLIPGSTNVPVEPAGYGFGTLTVSETGAVVLGGMLGEGTPVTASTLVSREGQWPLYVSLYGGRGSFLGWLAFSNNTAILGHTAWFKLAQAKARFYPAGFTNAANVAGSSYQVTNGLPALPFTQGSLSLNDGNLENGVTNQFALNDPVASGATMVHFRAGSGAFHSVVTDPATGHNLIVNGVVLQDQNIGAGFFLGTNQSGSVVLSPPE